MKWKFKKECMLCNELRENTYKLLPFLYFLFGFRNKSNVNMIDFCKLKDKKIDANFKETEIAKTNYETLLHADLDNESEMRFEKSVTFLD